MLLFPLVGGDMGTSLPTLYISEYVNFYLFYLLGEKVASKRLFFLFFTLPTLPPTPSVYLEQVGLGTGGGRGQAAKETGLE